MGRPPRLAAVSLSVNHVARPAAARSSDSREFSALALPRSGNGVGRFEARFGGLRVVSRELLDSGALGKLVELFVHRLVVEPLDIGERQREIAQGVQPSAYFLGARSFAPRALDSRLGVLEPLDSLLQMLCQ